MDNEEKYLCSPWIDSINTQWEDVLCLGKRQDLKKGTVIINDGQYINNIYYLRRGEVKMSALNAEGMEKIIWYIQNGSLFGETPFFDKKPCYNVFTSTQDCEVYLFSRECIFNEIIPKYPELAINMLESFANKVRVLSTQVKDITLRRPVTRVCKMLYYLSGPNKKEIFKPQERVKCMKKITQQDLASFIGVHRVTLNNVIADLKDEGIVENFSKNKITILNFKRLVEYTLK